MRKKNKIKPRRMLASRRRSAPAPVLRPLARPARRDFEPEKKYSRIWP